MPTDALLGQMFNLGFPAVIAILIFFAYRDQTKALLEVVRNNTRVISEFQATQSKTVDDLDSHDERAVVTGALTFYGSQVAETRQLSTAAKTVESVDGAGE